jgi:hypothetical protein
MFASLGHIRCNICITFKNNTKILSQGTAFKTPHVLYYAPVSFQQNQTLKKGPP